MKLRILTLLFLGIQWNCFAQNGSDTITPTTKIDKAYFKSYLFDTKSTVCAPFHASPKAWLATGGILVAGGTCLYFDKEINAFAQRNRTSLSNTISSHVLEHLSNGLYSVPTNFAVLGIAYLAKDKKLQSAGLQCLKAMAITSLIVTVPKYLFQRHRPFQDTPPDNINFEGPFGGFNHNSFPSGHSSSAFAIATVYASYYSNTIYIPVIAYSLAALTALSRVHDNKHWASDVLIGSAIGYGVGKLIARNALHKKKKQEIPEN